MQGMFSAQSGSFPRPIIQGCRALNSPDHGCRHASSSNASSNKGVERPFFDMVFMNHFQVKFSESFKMLNSDNEGA